jgi:hypothetical protein
MHKTILFLIVLLSALPAVAQRQRIVGLQDYPLATLTGRVVDAVESHGVLEAAVATPRHLTRTYGNGSFSLQVPVGVETTITISRTGYQTFTEKITFAGPESRNFVLQPLPTGRIVTTTGTTYVIDTDSVEFGYSIPFLGLRYSREAQMCAAGREPFKLDRDQIRRIIGPGKTATISSCCTKGPLSGAEFELESGERVTAYFSESCENPHFQIFARDHKTYELRYVEFSEIQEVVLP